VATAAAQLWQHQRDLRRLSQARFGPSRRVIYLLVNEYSESQGVINGGAQSARNLLLGLARLGVPFALVSTAPATRPDAAVTVTSGECQFGPIHYLAGLPTAQNWRDTALHAAIRPFLETLAGGVFHLVEVNSNVGTWLWALEGLPFKTVVTGLDYAWLCARSHLLRADGSICQGPRSVRECTRCYFDHAQPVKRLAQRTLLGLTRVPLVPGARRIRLANQTRLQIAGRFKMRAAEFRNVDALIAPSRALEAGFVENGFPAERVAHIRYGTVPGSWISFDERPPLEQGVTIGFVGKPTFDKGLDLLVGALENLRRDGFGDLRLVLFCGPHPSGFARAVLARAQAQPSWVEISSFDGRSSASIDAAHRRIHLQVAPSRWSDNLPNAVLEGLERGTPVLASDQGSMREMVVSGDNGWLFDPAGGLEPQLRRILAAPGLLKSLPFRTRPTRPPGDEARDVADLYARL
jgi:glycosyltransferase involved in cell wall biosynthesis